LGDSDAHLLQEAEHLVQVQETPLLPALHVFDAAAPARPQARPLAPEA
jgi:hypothetical protein